jgi:hypothetical protein
MFTLAFQSMDAVMDVLDAEVSEIMRSKQKL